MPASAKKAVIFDFDGVLVNSEIIALAELRDCLSEFGIERGWSEMVSGFLGVPFEDIRMFVSRETGCTPAAHPCPAAKGGAAPEPLQGPTSCT